MHIRPEQFIKELNKQPTWKSLLVAGDEPYLSIEMADKMREHLKMQGFDERDVFEVDGRFNWDLFIESTQSLSLFSEKKIVELRFANKPDATAQKELLAYLNAAATDLFVLISTPRLDKRNLQAKWVLSLDKIGGVVAIYPPNFNEYPQWIAKRANAKGLNISQEAIQLLAENNEGNLFSVVQELDYLALFFGHSPIDKDRLKEALVQSSRFITFDLSDALLLGDTDRIYRIITRLREEGEPPTLVNWLLHKELSILGKMLMEIENGVSLANALNSVWPQKKGLYQKALQRINIHSWGNLFKMVIQIDQAIKGYLKEDPWNAIMRLSFAIAGRRVLSLSGKINHQ